MNEHATKSKYEVKGSASELAGEGVRATNTKTSEASGNSKKNGAGRAAKTRASGNDAPVTQRDLVEFHKRVVEMFATLNKGLSETALKKASEDREEICKRVDEIEQAINSMEGLLRIELAPHIRTVLHEEMEDQRQLSRSGFGTFVTWVAAGTALLFVGAFFESEIKEFVTIAAGYLEPVIQFVTPK
jgi:paraquat-inducible protein B